MNSIFMASCICIQTFFSKRRFDEQQAEEWWSKNKDRVVRRYSPTASPNLTGSSSTPAPANDKGSSSTPAPADQENNEASESSQTN